MTKQTRQTIGLLSAISVYYLIHEGAHFLYAMSMGAFKEIHILGMGIQIDIYRELLTNRQLGIFCLVGTLSTQLAAYAMVLLRHRICRASSKVFRACCYYITIALLLLDPLYLSVLCSFFGGGDMNGIGLLLPEMIARVGFGLLLLINGIVFWKKVLPHYTQSFH